MGHYGSLPAVPEDLWTTAVILALRSEELRGGRLKSPWKTCDPVKKKERKKKGEGVCRPLRPLRTHKMYIYMHVGKTLIRLKVKYF